MRYVLAITVAAIAFVLPVAPARAQSCQPTAFQQLDMAGEYEGPYMRVVVYPCGGISVAWNNAYGTHAAAYGGVGRLVGSGIMARGVVADPMTGLFLDDSVYLGIKAAERGWVEMGTYGPSPDPYNMPVRAMYRLKKIA